MMNRFLLPIFIILSIFTSNAQEGVRQYAGNPKKSWSMVLFPDPQIYSAFERNQPILELMTAWVSENIDSLNIKMVACTGDLVQNNILLAPDGKTTNQTGTQMWQSVSRAFKKLDDKVPYILASGNHDNGRGSFEYRRSQYDRYFKIEDNYLNKQAIRYSGIDVDNTPSLTNGIYEFFTPDGVKNLFIVIEYFPRDGVLDWVRSIISQEQYKDHRAILLTHMYLNAANERIVYKSKECPSCNDGNEIWRKLVQPSHNIQLVLCGHISKPDDARGSVGFRTDKNASGRPVHQMLFNAQSMGGGWFGNGGDGWLRLLEFAADGKTVRVKTFSPLFDISPATKHLALRKEPYDAFSFVFSEK